MKRSRPRKARIVQRLPVEVVQPQIQIDVVAQAGIEPNPIAESPVVLREHADFLRPVRDRHRLLLVVHGRPCGRVRGIERRVGLKLEEPVLVHVRVLIVRRERDLAAHLEVAARRVEIQRV